MITTVARGTYVLPIAALMWASGGTGENSGSS